MNLRSLIFALMVLLAGCATTNRAPPAPPVVISESTWRQVDGEIVAASQDATGQAKTFARGSMDYWRVRVYERTEADFIPWFSSYWTQEWLAMKVTWYTMSAGEEKDSSAKRLAVYLQEQYHDRVLDPVAKEIDPDAIMGQATEFYVQLLGQQLEDIAERYGLPADQLDRRLKDIPAITLAPPATRSASLYQIVHTKPVDQLPAYAALIDKIHSTGGAALSEAGISSAAKRTSEKLEAQLASRGAASAAAAAAGRVAGMLISLGVAGFRAIVHEGERPEMEAQLRQNLNTAFDGAWLGLMKNPNTGVMAGVNYLSGQIEGGLATSMSPSIRYEPVPKTVLLRGEQPLQNGQGGNEAPAEYWSPDE